MASCSVSAPDAAAFAVASGERAAVASGVASRGENAVFARRGGVDCAQAARVQRESGYGQNEQQKQPAAKARLSRRARFLALTRRP